MTVRRAVVAAFALLILALATLAADARPWRRYGPWPGYGYGWPGWAGDCGWGGWGPRYGTFCSSPNVMYYVPPLAPEPAVMLPRKRCAAGRAPARWVKTRAGDRIVWQHVMSRCR